MRPTLRLLSDELIRQIVDEARQVVCELGVTLHNEPVLDLLAGHGARIDPGERHVWLTPDLIDVALASAPASFRMYDVLGGEAEDVGGDRVHFAPGSAAIRVLDGATGETRSPRSRDVADLVKLTDRLPFITSQATSIVPADVHERISDSYRLYLALLLGRKPTVTGTFTARAFDVMYEMQLAIRGSAEALRAKPLCIFSACPTSPLKWSDVTSQNVVDCARAGVPVEFISMPLAGFISPVTLVGTLVAHTAETLSGVVISQCAQPGSPVLWGGSPAIFDVRYETTPMGAIETQMIDCACNEIGKHLGLPTQAYIGLSDAKQLDAQAGFETANGITLAVLSGINHLSGPGMLDFESCFSLEKLVLDHEMCGIALRMVQGISPVEDFPAIPHFEELLKERHLLISAHTRRHLRQQHYFTGPVIDRANQARWREEGAQTLRQRARAEVQRLLAEYEPSPLGEDVQSDLTQLMLNEARRHGMDALPKLEA